MNLEQIDLWRLALDKNPDSIAFVDLKDRFAYCNKSWCKMLGYAESELLQMNWMQITATSDVGGDKAEADAIREGLKDDYYLEKEYIRKDGKRIQIGLYVHRYPTVGDHEGFVVFAKPLAGTNEYQELKHRFQEMEKMILLFQHSESTTNMLAQRMEAQERELRENRELMLTMLNRGDITVKTGDNITGDHNRTNRSRTQNDTKIFYAVIMAIGFICTVLISIAAVLAYIAYSKSDNPNIKPPEINQPVLGHEGHSGE